MQVRCVNCRRLFHITGYATDLCPKCQGDTEHLDELAYRTAQECELRMLFILYPNERDYVSNIDIVNAFKEEILASLKKVGKPTLH